MSRRKEERFSTGSQHAIIADQSVPKAAIGICQLNRGFASWTKQDGGSLSIGYEGYSNELAALPANS
jgi:hypothetical protein